MKSESASPRISLGIIRVMSLLVPANARRDWRREWEAELINRWLLCEEWQQSTLRMRSDLLKRSGGALFDVLWFQERRARLLFVTLNILVAGLTGFGAVQEFFVRVFLKPETQPFLVSLAGITVSVLFVISGFALVREWRNTRRLIIGTGVLSILLHVYGALPPHRNMGYVALLLGAGYGLLMLVAFEWQRRRKLVL
jgi:hypothetical protein